MIQHAVLILASLQVANPFTPPNQQAATRQQALMNLLSSATGQAAPTGNQIPASSANQASGTPKPQGAAADPTQPSDIIGALLSQNSGQPAEDPALLPPEPPAIPTYRLKALLRSSADQGTALLESSSGKKILVPLERRRQLITPFSFQDGPSELELVDFKAGTITFRNVETGKQVLVN